MSAPDWKDLEDLQIYTPQYPICRNMMSNGGKVSPKNHSGGNIENCAHKEFIGRSPYRIILTINILLSKITKISLRSVFWASFASLSDLMR